MGAGLEMTHKGPFGVLAVLALVALTACGNDPIARETKDSVPRGKALVAGLAGLLSRKAAPAPASPELIAAARAGLEQAGNPIILAALPKRGYLGPIAPYGQNGGVVTWAGSTLETVALKDGILVATRGFGADLMAARVPDLDQVRQASGYFHRGYSYLDGADQGHFYEYDCTFAPAGTDTIDVFGRTYAARKVIESCENPESTFQNTYWFDSSGTLRQSDQRVSPELEMIRLQRIVD
jgi:hypothetical protein